MRDDRVTEDDVYRYGWNSIERDEPFLNAAVHAQQLHFISRLLVEIRDLLEGAKDDD